MKKLTKIINKRRKNYKPTIGIEYIDGTRMSFNAVVYYHYKALEEKERAEAEARKFLMRFVQEACPDIYRFASLLGSIGRYM